MKRHFEVVKSREAQTARLNELIRQGAVDIRQYADERGWVLSYKR